MNERTRHFRKHMADTSINKSLKHIDDHEELNVIVLPQTPQLRVSLTHGARVQLHISFCQGIYTILRDQTTSRQDFIFSVDRLATFLVEKAMELLPYRNKIVTTPTDTETSGKELDVNVCS